MKQLDPKAVWLFFLHYIVGWFVLAVFLFGFVLFPFLFEASSENGGFGVSAERGWWIGPLILLTVFYIWARLSYRYYRYELTDIVFKKEHGVIWKRYISIPYDRIQNVDIHRGIIARLLGLSDVQIQTAGGITMGSYGAFSEGRLIGVSREEAEKLRDELIQRARSSRGNQGL